MKRIDISSSCAASAFDATRFRTYPRAFRQLRSFLVTALRDERAAAPAERVARVIARERTECEGTQQNFPSLDVAMFHAALVKRARPLVERNAQRYVGEL